MVQTTLSAKCPSYNETSPLKLVEPFEDYKPPGRNFQKSAIIVCAVSIITNLLLFIIGVVFAIIKHSPATYAFAIDCVLDCVSSIIVLWRYLGSSNIQKEKKACIGLGCFFIIAGIGVIIQGGFFIACEEKPRWSLTLVILAGVGFVVCMILSFVKYLLYTKLENKSLFLDALNSVLSGVFALVIIINDVVYIYDERIWYLDPLLSIILSALLVAYGVRVIIVHWRGDAYYLRQH